MLSEIKRVSPFIAISEVSMAMNSTLDPDKLLDLILFHCVKLCNVESGTLMMIDNEEERLDIVRTYGISPDVKKNVRLKIGEGITGLVAQTGKPKLLNDVNADPYYISIKSDLRSELAVPMIVEDVIIGVISLDSNRTDIFTLEHLEIVSILANQAALIFKNLQSYHSLELKNRIQQVLLEISKVVTSTLVLNDIFVGIIEILEKSLKLEKVSFVLYDPQIDRLKIVAAAGLSDDEIQRGTYEPGEGITGKVFETGIPVLIPSLAKDQNFLNRVGYLNYFENDPENVSLLSAPVRSESGFIGVLTAFLYNQKNTDLRTYLDFLQVVASMISQAFKIKTLVEEAKKEISQENVQLKRELKNKYLFGSLIGKSMVMEKLFEKIRLVADSRASVLISGESGTGKEIIASAIHYNSNRADKPFIKLNCAAIPENLLESELFGHKKGSFTGAVADKKGKFELADGGTIFLDEIGELDLNLQSKLLRVLQEREVEAVGSVKSRKIDIRVIAATNSNLEKQIQEKKFRADLFYRLNVVNIQPPPLRERKEDIPLLISHFIHKYTSENNKNIKGISREAIKLLSSYSWPGNVRELENLIERAVVLSQNEILNESDFVEIQEKVSTQSTSYKIGFAIGDSHLMLDLNSSMDNLKNLDMLDGKVLEVVLSEVESRLIVYALKRFKYTKIRAAKYLGINRNTLDKKIKEFNLEY